MISFCMFAAPLMAYAVLALTFDEVHDSESLHLFGHAGAFPSPAEYGKHWSDTAPLLCRYSHALARRPPWHPKSAESQLTRSSGDNAGDGFLVAMATRSLSTSVAENAQQLPHCC